MKMELTKIVLFMTLAAFMALAGCQSALEGGKMRHHEAATALTRLSKINSFKSSGKLGIITTQKRHSVSFSFRLDNGEEKLELISPIGSLIASITTSIEGKQGVHHVALIEDKRIEAGSMQELLKERLGIDLPPVSLSELLLGKPHWQRRGSNTVALGEFDISYQNFMTFNGCPVPTDIKIDGHGTTILVKQSKINELK